jgi:hypothetical protein
MMNSDEVPRGQQIPYQQMRKPYQSKYQDNRYNSSPSMSYNYNSGNGYAGQQHPRRRTDRFKRETINYSERIMKQNDLIIRLLKEIRDRLPAPAVPTSYDTADVDGARQNTVPAAQQAEEVKADQQEQIAASAGADAAEDEAGDDQPAAEQQPSSGQ